MAVDDKTKTIACGSCCGLSTVAIIVVLALSFHQLAELDYGIDFDKISHTINSEVFTTAGLHPLGPGHEFITYPKTLQTIEFSAAEGDRLQTRTSDGLAVSLGISFQYRFDPTRLIELYMNFKELQLEVYEKTARATIANAATNYSAYTFFNDKAMIARAMQVDLTYIFDAQLCAFIDAFQITQVELPDQFQQAIVASITAQQNITQTQRYRDNMLVTFDQEVLVANQTRLQTIALAEGQANRILEEASASVAITTATVEAEMYSYGNISTTVGLDEAGGLAYIWWDQQAQQPNQGKEFLVGMNPDTYIRAD
jgi:regulator of protease activity HflC (stomatin/prohibitin superfamily)